MASGRLLKKARTALSPRYSPSPTNTSTTPQSQAGSSSTALAQASPGRLPSAQPVLLRNGKFQDDMTVKSTEAEEQGYTGLRHYNFMQRQKKLGANSSLDQIDYCDADLTNADATFESDTDTETFTGPPSPPINIIAYTQPMYVGTTHNPAVFLAILRIAQRNLPGTDLVSALNHIPNMRPADPLPTLTPSAPGNLAPAPFLDFQQPEKRPDDDDINIAFLPYFYGERHGVAFWQYVKDFKRGTVLGSACVTPCSEEDLRRYGLVEYIAAEDLVNIMGGDDANAEGVDMMRSVVADEGMWLEKNVVEDWEEWRATFRTCAVHWEGRMRLMRGAHEG